MLEAVHVSIGIVERSQINNRNFHLKKIEIEEQMKPKVSRRKGLINIRAGIKELKKRKVIEKMNKTKSCFSEKHFKNSQSFS